MTEGEVEENTETWTDSGRNADGLRTDADG